MMSAAPEWLERVAMFGLGVVGIGGSVAVAVHITRRDREADTELYARMDHCYSELASRRGLTVERHTMQHPIIGDVPIPPILYGTLDGFAFLVRLEGDEDRMAMVLRVSARAGAPDWPGVRKACRDSAAVPAPARAPLEQLCALSCRVELTPRELIAEPRVPMRHSWWVRAHRIETDPVRLEVWLEQALRFAASL